MREFLFRGKDHFGEWQYGAVSKFSEGFVVIVPPLSFNKQVEPESVGQFIGLTDKNGTKIFEGDIVEYKEEYAEIVFDEQTARFTVEFDTWCTDFDHINSNELEIIGNTTDNPELLEVNANA